MSRSDYKVGIMPKNRFVSRQNLIAIESENKHVAPKTRAKARSFKNINLFGSLDTFNQQVYPDSHIKLHSENLDFPADSRADSQRDLQPLDSAELVSDFPLSN